MLFNLVNDGWIFRFLLLGFEESMLLPAAVNTQVFEGRVFSVLFSILLRVGLLGHAILGG